MNKALSGKETCFWLFAICGPHVMGPVAALYLLCRWMSVRERGEAQPKWLRLCWLGWLGFSGGFAMLIGESSQQGGLHEGLTAIGGFTAFASTLIWLGAFHSYCGDTAFRRR